MVGVALIVKGFPMSFTPHRYFLRFEYAILFIVVLCLGYILMLFIAFALVFGGFVRWGRVEIGRVYIDSRKSARL